jgi:hypothetical protein
MYQFRAVWQNNFFLNLDLANPTVSIDIAFYIMVYEESCGFS